MKKIFCCLIFILTLAGAACARPEAFGNFRAEIPSGWSGELQNTTLVIKHKSKTASIAVAFNKLGGADLSDIVERLYIQMEGRDLEQDEDGDYNFIFVNSAGVESIALITAAEGYYLVISVSGIDDGSLSSDFETILDSIDFVDE